MAQSAYWPSIPKFSPLGTNPPVSLTQDLAPEQSADVLLLGCSDARDILYTLSTDVTCPAAPRKLDFTCCDIESAMLARNIILFTLLEEGVPSNQVWDIFYHIKLTDETYTLLTTHSRKLANLAISPETWRKCKYGSFIKMVDAATLPELRRLWTLYAEFSNLPSARLDKLYQEQEGMSKRVSTEAKQGFRSGFSRSAAGMWREALKPVNEEFRRYWELGTTAKTKDEISNTTKLNPTFCYSKLGETFGISDLTFPQGFHFSAAFTPISHDPVGPTTKSAIAKAKQQFNGGCVALQASRQKKSVMFRFFIGDALSLCRAFDQYNRTKDPQTGEFAAHWRATPIDLTESLSGPTTFDVISCTTRLYIDLSLFNLLLAGQPLLKKQPASQAVLYTDVMFDKRTASDGLPHMIYQSVPTAGVLLGLVPRSYVSLFTTTSTAHMMTLSESSNTFIERIPWVSPLSGDTYTEPTLASGGSKDIIQLVFNVYREMVRPDSFSHEDLSPTERRSASNPRFTRETFARFIAHVKSRIHLLDSDWQDVVKAIQGLVALHGTKCGMINHFHDLYTQIDLYGLRDRDRNEEFYRNTGRAPLFRNWTDVPRLVCMVLIVPRAKLDPIRNDHSELVPRLVCEYGSVSNLYLTHSSIQTVWGKCVPLQDSDRKYVIEEDPEGLYGSSDLVVSFWTDAEMLVPTDTNVSLCLRNTPLMSAEYGAELGPRLQLYTTDVTDAEHVLVLRERPMGAGQTQVARRYTPTSITKGLEGVEYGIKVKQEGAKDDIDSMIARFRVNKAKLANVGVGSVKQVGPCTLNVGFGGKKRTIRFPYPVRGTDCRVTIDKVGGTIEVVAEFFDPISTGGYPNTPFPILRRTSPSPWNVHHLHLERMPKVDTRQQTQLHKWLVEHTSVQMSDRERVVQRSSHVSQRPTSESLVGVKESIAALVQDYVGIRIASQGPLNTFGLIEPRHGFYIMIFVSGLRLDLGNATLALDCAVVPISLESGEELSPGIALLDASTPVLQVRTRPAEVIAWKHLLPAFVERCRMWSHKPDCAYKKTGKIPLSEKIEVDPLCKCGRGQNLSGPEWKNPAWKGLLPYATRAAISPLFGVPILETVAGPASTMTDTKKPVSWGEPTDVCWRCGGVGRPLLRCARCKKARYCSKECQKTHWNEEHKNVCKAP